MNNKLLGAALLALGGSTAFAYTEVNTSDTAYSSGGVVKWTAAGSPYVLNGVIYVKNGTTLDIEPGVVVRGQPQTDGSTFNPGTLVITTTGKIQARGTSTSPIIFTTAAIDAGLASGGAATGIFKDLDSDGYADRWTSADGDTKYLDLTPASAPLPPKNGNGVKNANFWGGIVIAGTSLTNSGNQVNVDGVGSFVGDGNNATLDDGFGIIEGLSGDDAIYGGSNSEHNGGIVKYVSIRHGGANLVAGKELNGLTLYAVGSKTTVSYVDVYATGDDGVEIFGGTVNADHLNLNYCDDDGLDIDEGYQGTVQYVFVLQGQGFGDNGFELDGEDKLEANAASNPLFPVGDARIYNATVLVDTAGNASLTSASGARMRAGFAGQIANSILLNVSATTGGNGFRVDGLKTSSLGSGETAEYGNSARDHFASGALQLRNNTSSGFTKNYVDFTTSGVSITTSGAVSGITLDSVLYPAVNLRTTSPLIPTPNHTSANGVDPRPALTATAPAYGLTQDAAYVYSPAAALGYKGAFDRTVATLWTTGWTALNKRGVLKN